ncbi:MAG: transporter substrate-binding domain-containing protein [Ruminococcus flavefaciens]|nr:transporter substrate-binding domain-containing protein [Ruminococcus flavefaciens]
MSNNSVKGLLMKKNQKDRHCDNCCYPRFFSFFAVNILFSSKHSDVSADSDKATEYTDFNEKKIGIKTSSAFEEPAFRFFPDSEYYYYDSTSDLAAALISNKIDGSLEDEPVARMLNVENNSISYLNKPIIKDDYSFVFTKADPSSEKYVSEFNIMLAEMKENGELEQLKLK